MCEIITTKHNISSKLKEIQEVENNVYQKEFSLEKKKIATALIIMILCLVTFTLPWKHCNMTIDSIKPLSLVC